MPTVASSTTVSPFLMFTGDAADAVEWYISLFDDGEVLELRRWGEDSAGEAGTVEFARVTLGGATFLATDSPDIHEFDFTPAISLFVECDDATEVDHLFEAFAEDGDVLMPLDSYPFASRFAWVQDRYGVSWQLSAE